MVKTGKGKTIQRYVAEAKRIEKEHGVRTSVVVVSNKSKLPMTTTGDGVMIALVEPMANDAALTLKVRDDMLKHGLRMADRGYCFVTPAPPIREAVDLIKSQPEAMRWGLASHGFLAPVFHKEVYGDYYKELDATFKRTFGLTYRTAIAARIARYNRKIKGIRSRTTKQRIAEKELETKLLGKREQRMIIKRLEQITTELVTQNPDILIVLDRSGRPVGRALNHLLKKLGKKTQVFFLDPHIMKTAMDRNGTAKKEASAKKVFAKEFPGLIKALPNASVAIIDDQIHEGLSFNAVEALLKKYSPRVVYRHYLNQVTSLANEVSWRKHRVHEIELGENTFRSRRKKLSPEEKRKVVGLRKGWNVITAHVARRLGK